jgi:hypothetical protein
LQYVIPFDEMGKAFHQAKLRRLPFSWIEGYQRALKVGSGRLLGQGQEVSSTAYPWK